MVSTGIGLTALGMLFYVRDVFGAPPAVVSIFGSVWTAVYSIACIVGRPLSVRLLPRYSLMIATGGMASALVMIPLLNSLTAAFIFYGLYGASISFFWPPLMGWASAGLEQADLSRTISRFNLSWSTGAIIGPFLGGALFELSPRAPAMTGIGLFASTFVMIAAASIVLPRVRSDVHRESPGRRRGEPRRVDESSPLRFPAWVTLFSTYFTFGVIVNVAPLYLRETLGLSESLTGLVLLFRAIASTTLFIVLGRSSFWHHKKSWLASAHVLVILAALVLGTASSAVLYATIVGGFGVILAISYNNSVFHGASGTIHRAARMAVHESTLTGGVVAGSITGGILYQTYSIVHAFLACAVVAGVLGIGAAVMIARSAKTPATP